MVLELGKDYSGTAVASEEREAAGRMVAAVAVVPSETSEGLGSCSQAMDQHAPALVMAAAAIGTGSRSLTMVQRSEHAEAALVLT